MKLLVTDYDGTFKSDIKNLYLNIKTIDKFKESGNKFAIVTGRSFDSIKKEIDYYKIKYDYLSCNNGLIIFDNQDNILSASALCMRDLKFIYNSVTKDKDVIKTKLYNFYDSTDVLNIILEVYVEFKNITTANEYKKYIENLMPHIKCYREHNKLFISNNRSKADAVYVIQKLENIDFEEVYTVGDSKNDLEMLQEYNGYKMLYSSPSIFLKKIPTTKEVHTLVKKISK